MSLSSPEKEILHRFARYVFKREAKELREDLYESTVEMALHLKNKPMNPKTIRNEVLSKLGLDFNQAIIDSAIEGLVRRDLVKQKNELLSMSESRRKEIDKTMRERSSLLREIERKFTSEYHNRMKRSSPKQDRAAVRYLYSFLSSLFSSEGKLLLAMIRGSGEDIKFVREYEPPRRILRNMLSKIENEQLRKAVQDSIFSILRKDETVKLLNVVARNYLYFQLLNVDPECRFFQKELFSKKVVLLDTNFVMRLLFVSESGHEAAIRCASLSKELGVHFQFTNRTKQEFLDQLHQSNERYNELRITRTDTLSSLDDDIIASYAHEKEKNPKLEWNDFYYKYRSCETELKKLGISEFKELLPTFEVYKGGLEGPVTGYVLSCWQDLTGQIKHDAVAEHDCYHLLLVRKLRQDTPADVVGPRFWFLTSDASLLCVDKAINQVIGRKNDLPSSVEFWVWTELIAQYSAPRVAGELGLQSFSDFMRTSLPLLPGKIDTRKLVAIQTSRVNFDLFSPEQIKAILSDEFVEQHWNRLVKSKQMRSPLLEQDRKQLQARAEDVAKEILTKKTHAELAARYVSGAMAIFALIFSSYCAVVGNYFGTTVFAILTIILIAIAVGYSTIEVGFRKLHAKLTRT